MLKVYLRKKFLGLFYWRTSCITKSLRPNLGRDLNLEPLGRLDLTGNLWKLEQKFILVGASS